MTFRVGQKVVCVDDRLRTVVHPVGFFRRFRKPKTLWHNLNRGEVYTVTFASTLVDCATGKEHSVIFVDGAWHSERWAPFPAFQFRAIVERKNSIAFTHGADPSTDKLDNRRKVKERA